MIARLVAVVVGIWLMVSPAVLDYGDPAQANDRIVGPIAGGIAFVAIWDVLRPLRWAVLPFGIWQVVVPLLLTYDEPVMWVNSIVTGLVLAATVPFGAIDPDDFGGGWSTVWDRSRATWTEEEVRAQQRAWLDEQADAADTR